MVADAPARAKMDLRADGWPVRDQVRAADPLGWAALAAYRVAEEQRPEGCKPPPYGAGIALYHLGRLDEAEAAYLAPCGSARTSPARSPT